LMTDSRLVGRTAEDIFLSLLNGKGIFANRLDAPRFDGIIFDFKRKIFKVGKPPNYVQIKCRGSQKIGANSQGHSPETFRKMLTLAKNLRIPISSLYLALGFYKDSDIRKVVYYVIPFGSLRRFKGGQQYRFSVRACEEAMRKDRGITKL
ncbi:MAG: hypothetical protein ACRENF_01015, partial [Thermodesulfobacteriota bacterium]